MKSRVERSKTVILPSDTNNRTFSEDEVSLENSSV